MPLPDEFLQYPLRRHGMDHDRYQWSNLFERSPVLWENDTKVAVLITVPIEFFPLNPQGKPFKSPGSMVTAYPDFRHYTTRDYGNRVAVFRFLKCFKDLNIKANFAVNSEVAERYPALIAEIVADGHEIVAHGINMDTLHYGGMDEAQERAQIETSVNTLRRLSGQAVAGWMSPAVSESFNTPDLLTEFGINYVCDWANDELPYPIKTTNGDLMALPVSQELNDRQIIVNYHHTEESFGQQIKDQFDWLYHESVRYGGRILSLTLHPYIMGLPYRIQTLREALTYVMSKPNVSALTGTEVLKPFVSDAAAL
ncbi:MAG: polysaccharide deacetylase [Cytophagia bacterium]|nr:MAG: polysaccharide deacetylase [Runella sp.]TAG16736.1 MAG: polysaccharide deacetylase [Cytophagales bacterium]TAG34766.1 MAG: polysaccharide deacetylase [Cytophagia bacterium]TAG76821.1 MAG: polysaccharide deacetylase [Cytophagales bacterium]